MLQIAVCGDSAIAHSIAAISGWRGHAVSVLTTTPAVWRDRLAGNGPGETRFIAPIDRVTDDPGEALVAAEVVLICVPHARIEAAVARIAPHVKEGMLIGGIPGFGGFGLLARKLTEYGCCVFGTQRIPFVVRAYEPGRSVRIGAVRRQTFVGTMPAARARPVAELVGELLGVPTVPVSHYLNIELSPSNSIVNPARLYALFGPQVRGVVDTEQEFFKDWNLDASRILLEIDRELQVARRSLPRDMSFVAPILLQYDSNDALTLTDRFRNLRALAGRPVPARIVGADGRMELDPMSAYLREDVDIGLAIVRDILRLAEARTPLMDEILAWGSRILRQAGLPGEPRARPGSFDSIERLAAALD